MSNALPRLKNAPDPTKKQSSSKSSSKTRGSSSHGNHASSSSNATLRLKAAQQEQVMQMQLAREAEILSLLTALNQPVMNAELPATLQAVKAHLYARNYAAAFGQPDYLRAYTARWVSGRALAYRSLFMGIHDLVEESQKRGKSNQITRALCIGGGAGSEILALASLTQELSDFGTRLQVTAVDSADWTLILDEMGSLIKSRWKMNEDTFGLIIKHQDILDTYATLPFQEQDLITCLYTTNELFSASRVKTMSLLSHLSQVCKEGALLVIAESTGSYSEIQVGTKTYPLELILDQKLAGKNGEWEVVCKDQSLWYRVPEESKGKYGLQIENTHMLVRVYRKL
ncbi:hypothetical protein P389DRAFT_212401 [Cystobasidium minutum MCA 4210]|uniref:uncharacterized protein n=1 Tax=Cystobasidium minutum MCA 4210 TaxID=1397322 RepID=UPI0034CDBFAC|eukprot:jgi/Rhomi1/212401/estExt_Genemark1.C_60312